MYVVIIDNVFLCTSMMNVRIRVCNLTTFPGGVSSPSQAVCEPFLDFLDFLLGFEPVLIPPV